MSKKKKEPTFDSLYREVSNVQATATNLFDSLLLEYVKTDPLEMLFSIANKPEEALAFFPRDVVEAALAATELATTAANIDSEYWEELGSKKS